MMWPTAKAILRKAPNGNMLSNDLGEDVESPTLQQPTRQTDELEDFVPEASKTQLDNCTGTLVRLT